MSQRDRLTFTSRLVVRGGVIVNRIFLAGVCGGLALTAVFPVRFAELMVRADAADVPAVVVALRLLLVVGIVMAVATDRLLVKLAAVVASAAQGDPFVAANARRLQAIGWWLLVLQLLDLPKAFFGQVFSVMGSAAPTDGAFSLGGWLAVLMVFVLARVFAAGAAMRDELAGTV